MIDRRLKPTLRRLLDRNPAVVLIGPGQVGKTTLAQEIATERDAVYVDLELPSDLAKISDVKQYCAENANRLVILDEVHRAPGLFAPLRGIIDRQRLAGKRTGMFLLLGSASVELLRQSGETLAGRVAHCEHHPFGATEVPADTQRRLWCRGGLPDSLLAPDDAESLDWRVSFIRSYLERDIPQLGPRIPAEKASSSRTSPAPCRPGRRSATIDEYLLAEIDATAKQIGSDRSKFLAAAARAALDHRGATSPRS